MDKIEKVTQILDLFMREEVGNRLSQFAMIALRDMIVNVIKEEEVENVKEEKAKE